MMKKLLLVLMVIPLAICAQHAQSISIHDAPGYGQVQDDKGVPQGCLTAPNGQYPPTNFTPACNGNNAIVTTGAWTGEYSVIEVTSGTVYTFSVSNPAYFITIGNGTGTVVLAYGTGSLTWTATLTGTVRFYVHIDNSCASGTSSTSHTRYVKCGNIPVEPDYGCDQIYAGAPDLATSILKTATLGNSVANDFFVPKESAIYRLQSVTADIVPIAPSGSADIVSFDIQIRSNGPGNTPGAVIQTMNNVIPASITPLPIPFGSYPSYAVTLGLNNFQLPVNSGADTRYWISLQAVSASNSNIYWIGYQHIEGWLTAPNYFSPNGGSSWSPVTSPSAPGQYYDSLMAIDAECSTAAVDESGTKLLTFYPNPVRDYLTINSNSAVDTVHIYSTTGQKIPVLAQLMNGKVDMRKLAPGIYIVTARLKNGKTESFKVIKK